MRNRATANGDIANGAMTDDDMTNRGTYDVLDTAGAGTARDLPAGYTQYLRDRHESLTTETSPPPFNVMLDEAIAREELHPSRTGSHAIAVGHSEKRRSRRSMTILSASAAVAIILVGVVVALGQRGESMTVEVAGPGSSIPGAADGDSGTQGAAAPSGVDGLPLLFPPGPVDEMQARVGADPEIQDPDFVIFGSLEMFVAGEEGAPAQLVTVLSVPEADTTKAFGLMNMPREFIQVLEDDGPLDTAVLENGVRSMFPSEETLVQTRELTVADLVTEGPAFEVWIKRWAGRQIDSRIILIPTRTATTVVMASNIGATMVDDIVANLMVEGDLLRAGAVPDGFDDPIGRSDRIALVADASYAVMAPPADDGPVGAPSLSVPTRLAVNQGANAASTILLWNDPFVAQARPYVLSGAGSWALATLDPAVAMGAMDGAWVTVGSFTVEGRTGLDDPENVSSLLGELRQLWEGIQGVEPGVFDYAIERYLVDDNNLFGDTVRSPKGTATTVEAPAVTD